MLANRDMAVEAAKKMVSMQFNLADGLSGMDIGNAGYLYETDSSNEFENNLVEIEGTYAGAGKESGTVLLKSENKKNTLVMVKETVYSRSITSNKSIAIFLKSCVITKSYRNIKACHYSRKVNYIQIKKKELHIEKRIV